MKYLSHTLFLALLLLGTTMAFAAGPDLSSALADCTIITPEDPENANDWLLKKNLASDLSDSEQRMLSEFRTPAGQSICLERIISYTRIYMSGHGDYPHSATDALKYSGKLADRSEEELAQLDGSELLEYYNFAINPLTGKFYDSFDNEEWVPFGILVKPIIGEDGIQLIPGPVAGTDPYLSEMEMQPMRTWLIRVYGETPGRVLLEGNIWTDARDENDRWWK